MNPANRQAFSPPTILYIVLMLLFFFTAPLWGEEPWPEPLKNADTLVLTVAVSPDGNRLATGSYQTIRIWNVNNHAMQQTWQASQGWIRTLAFSPDGQHLASAGDDGSIHLWDWENSRIVHLLNGKGGIVYSVAFSPDGKTLASGTEDHRVHLWNVKTGQPITTLDYHTTPVRSLAFGPQNNQLVSGAEDGTLTLWNLDKNPATHRPLKGTRNGIYSVAFSPDGSWIAAGTLNTVQLWDAHTGRIKQPLRNHSNWVRSLAFSPDSTLLASAADDGLLNLWKLSNGSIVQTWKENKTPVFAVSALNETSWISAGGDGQTRIWQHNSPKPLWILIGATDGNWLACRSQKHRCWRHEQSIEEHSTATTPSSEEPFDPFENLDPWLANTLKIITLLTVSVVVWSFAILPLYQRKRLLMTLCQRYIRQCGMQFYPPSPIRFARRLEALLDPSTSNTPNSARIILPDNFPLALRQFFYMRVPEDQSLQNLPSMIDPTAQQPPLLLLVGHNQKQINQLRLLSQTHPNHWVVPDYGEMTQLLLSAHPQQAFIQLLANHVEPLRLSPYQGETDHPKPAPFFGRAALLKTLLHHNNHNAIVMGGQKMGKTSLLQALARHYKNHPAIQCSLFTPDQENPNLYSGTHCTPKPSQKRPPKIALDMALDVLMNASSWLQTGGSHRKKQIFLIDDADPLILADAKENFILLNKLRHLNEEKQCYFVLAGSWGVLRLLHAAQSSALKDCIDIHTLGPLDATSSWDLLRLPMAMIQREWDSGVWLELIQASSSRPDWIAALCHEMLHHLTPHDTLIHRNHWESLLASPKMADLLNQWVSRISDNEEENRQDRFLAYSTANWEYFTQAEILATLLKSNTAFFTPKQPNIPYKSPAIQLQHALDRLEMACVLQKIDSRYFYPSKRLRTIILQQKPKKQWTTALQKLGRTSS